MKKYLIFTLAYLVMITASIAQDVERLENSPRHHEWVYVKNGDREIKSFVAYPEVSENVQTVIVIHENRGLTDWVRSMADQLAEMGYIAIAPDLLSDFSPEIKSTNDFENSDAARDGIYKLEDKQVLSDLDKVYEYLKNIDGGNGDVSVIGFCWGGSTSFKYATHNLDLQNALVFYGTAPTDSQAIQKIGTPVYGFYGGNDQRVNASIAATEESMKKFGKFYDYEIYEGAGHAFMRSGEDPNGSEENKAARQASLIRIKQILK